MRYFKIVFLVILGIVLCFLALANRDPIILRLVPSTLEAVVPVPPVRVPAFIAIFGGILLGLLVGFVWEWLREYQHRSLATKSERKIRKLENEVSSLRTDKSDEDEILQILDSGAR